VKNFKLLVIAASTFFLVACGLPNLDMYVIYDTHAEAVADEAIQRGWIPTWVPPTATNIHEAHNLDTNARALSFTAPNAKSVIETLRCRDDLQPPRPSKKTKLFPTNIEHKAEIKNCGGLWVFVEGTNDIHVWANSL